MFYTMYLSSLCQRRQWPDPSYEPFRTRNGHFCKVRVNNREYSTEVPYASEALARDGAAQKAYMICRNFSVNDGMFPGQRPGQMTSAGAIQGLPVAIGTGRGSKRSSAASCDTASTDGTSSGDNSPRSLESGFEQQLRQVTQQVPKPPARSNRSKGGADDYVCYCRRAPVRAYGRCAWCLRESGWA
ncbi:hypothetical protein CLAFUW4_05577 [Fulvia fulva]|uniref:DRBM domain-containing protein n=1 Tax=Passalora fulva TaxID=5499 RepID=A0A9Q8LHZ5_PASFU|nr:uncharacterized protein CLAFUR5_05719 [Fulvia fulva]KAK4623653.1 hypothetical protein CLAFUR4_05571 [Fulvia fulva]KAK4625178.1 hypothetical protein CLAFUR0_05580 [Fulvia fulva]UJO17976.1 hypothetical protein CLAFUR5_05719 [Fulvia fulva]WPV15515.1 hypothetical protein CLAFUW4_05577 [Fulvia fulva]WPV30496.1 hypothetical protein CLAFUW7_05575 [Fulvia fulva]